MSKKITDLSGNDVSNTIYQVTATYYETYDEPRTVTDVMPIEQVAGKITERFADLRSGETLVIISSVRN
jgi:hypothetical protein